MKILPLNKKILNRKVKIFGKAKMIIKFQIILLLKRMMIKYDMEVLIDSLYGETGHLENKHHLEEFISYNEKNKNQISCIENLGDNKVRNSNF